MERKTPLYDCHVALNGKIVPFAGYLLPVQYPTGVIAEHMAVRQHAGIVYCIRKDCFLLVVNAANHEKDAAWITSHLSGDVKFDDLSDQIAQIALQGPESETILAKLCKAEEIPAKYYTFTQEMMVAGHKCLVSRTGYTGEDGFELYCSSEDAVSLWNAVLEAGKENGSLSRWTKKTLSVRKQWRRWELQRSNAVV